MLSSQARNVMKLEDALLLRAGEVAQAQAGPAGLQSNQQEISQGLQVAFRRIIQQLVVQSIVTLFTCLMCGLRLCACMPSQVVEDLNLMDEKQALHRFGVRAVCAQDP